MIHRLWCSAFDPGPDRINADRSPGPSPASPLNHTARPSRYVAGGVASLPVRGLPGREPPQRSEHLDVLLAERLRVLSGERVSHDELLARRAGNEVVVPDHVEIPLAPLHADLVAVSARRIAVDLTHADVL